MSLLSSPSVIINFYRLSYNVTDSLNGRRLNRIWFDVRHFEVVEKKPWTEEIHICYPFIDSKILFFVHLFDNSVASLSGLTDVNVILDARAEVALIDQISIHSRPLVRLESSIKERDVWKNCFLWSPLMSPQIVVRLRSWMSSTNN